MNGKRLGIAEVDFVVCSIIAVTHDDYDAGIGGGVSVEVGEFLE